jgi:hypothetical protein
MSGESVKQMRQSDAQQPRDQPQVENRKVTLAALDGADEGAVEGAFLGQLRLRPFVGKAALANAVAEFAEEISVADVHWRP